ncbi:MAG: DUF3857 domain-containing protein [Planctomycetota bacterium]|nr:DUF3857 domain-containing protein [Planctomycetota bacterium]
MIRPLRSGGWRAPLASLPVALYLLAPTALSQVAPDLAPRLERAAALILDGDTPALRRDFAEWIPAADVKDTAELEAALALAAITVGSPFPGASEAWFGDLQAPAAAYPLRARLAWLRGDAAELFPLTDWQFAGPFDNERGRGMRRRTPAERDPVAGPYDGKGAADDVRWRQAPAPGPLGAMDVHELFHTNEQICFVARTWVLAREAREAVLLLGATEEVRVWHDGEPVYEALDAHSFGFDGHGARLSLRAGWNELFLKVGGEDTPPTFIARLVEPGTGRPLALETAASAPEGVEPASPRSPGRRLEDGRGALPPGPRARVEGSTDAQDVLVRALLDARREAAPRKQRPGFEDASAAHAALRSSAAAALAHLATVRVVNALDIEEDVNPWLEVLRGAVEVHGPRFALMRSHALHAASAQGRGDRALELIGRTLLAEPASIPARALRVDLLESLGQGRAAEFEARALAADAALADHPGPAVAIALWLDAAEPARAVLLDAAGRGGSTVPRSLELEAAAARSDEEARDILFVRYQEKVAKEPFDVSARVAVARALLATGDADRARAFLDEAASLAPDRTDVNGWRARALALTGDTAGAIEALERVLRFDASAADEARLADHLRARGAAAAAGDFQDAYRAPLEDIMARASEPAEGVPREVLHRMLVIDAGADGTARRWGRTVERILTPAGARELDRLPFRAYPGSEEVRVLSASVHRADGTTLDARTGRTGGRGVFVVDLPPLEVGDVVDVEWRRDDLAPTIFGDYLGVDVPLRSDSRLPVVESTVVLLEPEGVSLTTHMTAAPDGVERAREELDGGGRETRWTVRDVEPRRRERLEPPSAELEPRVQASTYASWESFGEWWWNLISEEIDTSDEMRVKVAELTESASTPLERLRAVYDFVVTDVRYNAWEFGVHGYQPYSAPVIFSRRFGDCKDKAILMKAMLAEVGIEAWPVIIQAEGRRHEEDLSLAMVGHFNHCIAYVPAQEGIPEMFLDGTARHHPLEVLPDSDRGAKVVVVRDDGVDVRRVPFPAAADNHLVDETVVDMTGEGPARVEVVQRPRGRWDPLLRRTYGADETARAAAVERMLSRRFGAVVGTPEATHPDYEALDVGLELRMSAAVEKVGRPSDGGLELPSSLAPDELLSRAATESTRETDLLLGMPWLAERRIVYRLPRDSRVFDLPGSLELENEDMGYSRAVSAVPTETALEIVVVERVEQRSHRVPAERYDAFRETARAIDRAQAESIEVEVVR